MSEPTVSMRLTARDDTAKGVGSAEKRVGAMAKRTSKLNRAALDDFDKGLARSGGAIVKTFGRVEAATARLVGSSALTSGLSNRIGGIGSAVSALGSGMAETSVAGEGLVGVIGTVGAAAAGAVAAVAGLAVAAWSIKDGFDKSALSIANLSDRIGISTKALQEFYAAGERVGVDKTTSANALAGLSRTLDNAVYGKDPQAVSVLQKLGIKLTRKADGTADKEAILPQLADAIRRQNSSGRLTVMDALKIDRNALPIFMQGGAALKADMDDYGKHGTQYDDAAIARSRQNVRNEAIAAQLGSQYIAQPGGRMISGMVGDAEDWTARMLGVDTRSPAGGDGGAPRVSDKYGGGAGGQMSQMQSVIAAAQAMQAKYGIPASDAIAAFQLESGNGKHLSGKFNPFGIKAVGDQPGTVVSTKEFDKKRGWHTIRTRFRDYNSFEEAFDDWGRLLSRGRAYADARKKLPDAKAFAHALTGVYATDPQYGTKLNKLIDQQNLTQYDSIPVNVTVELKGAPSGTKTTVRAGKGKPAISTAVQP